MKAGFSGKQDVYLEIAERYRTYIRLGVLRAGERLPSVRTAAGELGVNPNTVARAYAVLETEGFVQSLPKKGIYVTGDSAEGSDKLQKGVIRTLRDRGISKETVMHWIEEVYAEND